ncbi:MAG: serine hydrolase [Oscillospiraceae bacterium]|nr:serine hydrolase [Oscillospiraceae bacterium]
MKLKKPDIFLGITLGMLVLTAVLCIVILFVQKNNKTPTPVNTDTQISNQTDTGEVNPSGSQTVPSDTGTNIKPTNPVELKTINESGLKAALDESLRGLTSEWQVMVTDPAKGSRITSAVNCSVDGWMTANRFAQVFIMGAVFQQASEGTLTLDSVLDDVKAMINKNDLAAADKLTEALGGGDAEKGREAVKDFAVDNGVKLGFNRTLSGANSKKNYVTAQQTAVLLDLICRGELVSEAASQQMLEILLTPNEELDIDPGLSTEGAKYGFITDIENDVCICAMGVVQLPNRSFVISVVCNKPVTTNGAKAKVTELITLTEPFFAE